MEDKLTQLIVSDNSRLAELPQPQPTMENKAEDLDKTTRMKSLYQVDQDIFVGP